MRRRTLLFMALGGLARAQESGEQSLGQGRLLVASRELRDPNFAETVVLLIEMNGQGTVGLVINRRTKATLEKVLTLPAGSKIGSDPVYSGGPVESSAALALMRSATAVEGARHVSGDMYVVATKPLLDKALAESRDAGHFRVYLGYGGWAPGQLEAEVELGAWRILTAKSGLVFDEDPDSLWDRLHRLSHTQIAMART